MKAPLTAAFVGFTASRHDTPLGSHGMPSRLSASHQAETKEDTPGFSKEHISRRSLLHSAGLSFAGSVSSGPLSALFRFAFVDSSGERQPVGMGLNAANAMGLVQFPCKPGELFNSYHMMRAGESGLEAEGILSTNPLFLTNREDALTDVGTAQVEEACNEMMRNGINPSVVKYSLASKCIDTANIVATKMMVGRNRIVPEFTFMDPRGAGLWDGKPLASTEAAIWAMDSAEAGNEGREGSPPPNDDGTANETLFNQVTRLRQLISILETQYSGDDILLIFPDGTSPALLSCLIAGIPLKNVHALNFMPGELRQGVDMNNARQLLKERLASSEYAEILARGKDELKQLRREHEDQLLAQEKPSKLLITKTGQDASKPIKKNQAVQNVRRPAYMDDGETNFSPDPFSLGAVGTMGALAMWRGDEIDTDESITSGSIASKKPAPVLAYANSTGTSAVFEQRATTALAEPEDIVHVTAATPAASSTIDTTEMIQMAATNIIDGNDGLLNPNVFEDVPVLSKKERVEAAEKAMEEYLSQDDGGDAWLSSMKDIMDE